MIYITGDTHRDFSRLYKLKENKDDMLIVLGDVGINYCLNEEDIRYKEYLKKFKLKIFCIRGNHEERPENINTYKETEMFGGKVFIEEDYPGLIFAKDGETYNIDGKSVLVIGGAYSVDKEYRLLYEYKWFKDEQLTKEEMNDIQVNVAGKQFDFVFTHTCPIGWEPSDLFLGAVDQSTVDKTMEIWLDEIKNTFEWKVWCFGHYHADRLERPCVEQMFQTYEDLEVIWNRWYDKKTIEAEWWITKSPNFYMDLPRNENKGD